MAKFKVVLLILLAVVVIGSGFGIAIGKTDHTFLPPEPSQRMFSLAGVGENRFTPQTTSIGNPVTVHFVFYGGLNQPLNLEIRQIDGSRLDQLFTNYKINHDGNVSDVDFTFTPDKKGTFYLDLRINDGIIWKQEDTSSYLTVN